MRMKTSISLTIFYIFKKRHFQTTKDIQTYFSIFIWQCFTKHLKYSHCRLLIGRKTITAEVCTKNWLFSAHLHFMKRKSFTQSSAFLSFSSQLSKQGGVFEFEKTHQFRSELLYNASNEKIFSKRTKIMFSVENNWVSLKKKLAFSSK